MINVLRCAALLSLGILTVLCCGCQLISQHNLVILPHNMPEKTALLQGSIIKQGQIQTLSAMVEADAQQVHIILLNPFGQRSRTLIADSDGFKSQHLIPLQMLISDAQLITSILCILAGPAYSKVHGGSWQGYNLIERAANTTISHRTTLQGDPWHTGAHYQKLSNKTVIFELQLQVTPI